MTYSCLWGSSCWREECMALVLKHPYPLSLGHPNMDCSLNWSLNCVMQFHRPPQWGKKSLVWLGSLNQKAMSETKQLSLAALLFLYLETAWCSVSDWKTFRVAMSQCIFSMLLHIEIILLSQLTAQWLKDHKANMLPCNFLVSPHNMWMTYVPIMCPLHIKSYKEKETASSFYLA